MITRRGAMAVVLDPQGRVLLLRREVFVLWDLPGGGIERGERPADAAVREAREETGYRIAIDRMVGQYTHQSVYGRGDQLTHVFVGRVVGGVPKRFGLEVTGLRWFPIDGLPRGLQPLQRQMILDAVSNSAEPFERRIDFPAWKLIPARIVFFFLRVVNDSIRQVLSWTRRSSRRGTGRS